MNLDKDDSSLEYFNDYCCKETLSLKKIVACTFQHFVSSYYESELEDIIKMIESQQTSKGHILESLNTERIEGKEVIRYDLYFKSMMPNGKIALFNLEPHSTDEPSVINRRSEMNIAYGIVKQKGVECSPPSYAGLKKVYTIWLIMTANTESEVKVIVESIKDSVTNELVEEFQESYQEKILIRLGTKKSEHKGIRFFQVIFSGNYRSEEVNKILEDKYGFRLDKDEMEVLDKMYGFSAAYMERGRIKGLAQGRDEGIIQGRNEGLTVGKSIGKEETTLEHIKKMMIKMNISCLDALDLFDIPKEEQEKYLKLIMDESVKKSV